MSGVPSDLLVLLDNCGTQDKEHSGRTLKDHLIGTYSLLKDWGNPEHVARAGLFHSIYGTQFYKSQSESLLHRENIVQGIGEQAEELVYHFCTTDRLGYVFELEKPKPKLWNINDEKLIDVHPILLQELVELDIANSFEEFPRAKQMNNAQRSHLRQKYCRCEAFVTTGARLAFEHMIDSRIVPIAI